ncbi:MAG: serine hydrolase domain-containing protein [Pyrinomonadaceae bacterium]
MKFPKLRYRPYLVLFSIFAFAVFAHGQSELEAKCDSVFASMNNTHSSGVAVTVIQNGKVLAKKSYGLASIEHQVPFTHQSVVRINYSEGREFISIAAVLMEQDGKLSLDDKVRKYFPDLPAWSSNVTVWDLLNHRSGFVDEWATVLLTQANMANRFDKSQFLRLLYTQPRPEIEPGKGYMYSNSDFGLLRLILEKASGEKLSAWMKKRMFDPLKMNSTRQYDDQLAVIPNFARAYSDNGDGKAKLKYNDKTSPASNYFIATSADDLALWAAAHADETNDIAKATAKLQKNVRLMPNNKDHYIFGQTVEKVAGQTRIFHRGVNEDLYLTRVPELGLVLITIGNRQPGFEVENKALLNYTLKTPETTGPRPNFLTKPIAVTKEELARYEGRYLFQDQATWQGYVPMRRTNDFFVSEGVLKIRFSGDTIYSLTPVGKGVFYAYEEGFGTQVTFSQTVPGSPLEARLDFDDGFPSIRMKKEPNIWAPTKAELSSFTGTYYSKHLNFYWTIVLNPDGKLIVRRPTIADMELIPDLKNEFRLTMEDRVNHGFDVWVRFDRDAKGKITHITAHYPRLMDHRFDLVSK